MRKFIIVEKGKDVKYLYRIASVNIDKVTLEKHTPLKRDPFDKSGGELYEINDETKVGTVTQKMTDELIPIISKIVDSAALDFEMIEKKIVSIDLRINERTD